MCLFRLVDWEGEFKQARYVPPDNAPLPSLAAEKLKEYIELRSTGVKPTQN